LLLVTVGEALHAVLGPTFSCSSDQQPATSRAGEATMPLTTCVFRAFFMKVGAFVDKKIPSRGRGRPAPAD
jgi:hypothetical protein